MLNVGTVIALIKSMQPEIDPTVIESAVSDWLDAHPEATTTVQDGSITEAKLATALAAKVASISSLSEEIVDLQTDVNSLNMAYRSPINLLAMTTLTSGKRQMANASSPESVNGYSMTDLIPVSAETRYAFLYDDTTGIGTAVYFAQYDANKSIILQSDNGYKESIKTGATTAYLRVSTTTTHFEANAVLAEAPFTGGLSTPSKQITGLYKATSINEIAFKGKNTQFPDLLEGHRSSLVASRYFANGNLTLHSNWMALRDYIPCEPSTDYNGAYIDQLTFNPTFTIAWYTEDGTFISQDMRVNNTVFTSPATAAYFRISCIQQSTTYPNAKTDFSDIFFGKTSLQYGPPCLDMGYVFNGIYPYSSLYGKKWVAFGDSITEKNVRATINYHDYIRAETGINVINKGLGGAGYKCRWQNDNNMAALADAYTFTDVDIVTCMAGINDAWSEMTSNMGDADDVYDTEATAQNQSVMACFNHFLDVVIEKAPYAKIGIISPLPCWTTSGGTDYHFKPDDDTSVLAVFVEKCKTACANRGIPYLDLFHTSGLRPWDTAFNNALFKCNSADSPDGLHPNYLGHKFFYPLVREFVKTLI